MRHAFLGGAISALLTLAPLSAAGAADLPVKARPMAPAPAVTPDWSGIYVGVVGGYAWVKAILPALAQALVRTTTCRWTAA